MKQFLTLLSFFCLYAALGQQPAKDGLALDSLPANVTGEWKFHAGDNPLWADTAFNDNGWQHVDATRVQHFLPQVTDAQIGWFRLTLHVVPGLRGKTVALIITQFGGADIYFNGGLVSSFGRPAANYKDEQTYITDNQPITLQLSNAPTQYLAIRYSFNKHNLVIGWGRPVIEAYFDTPTSALKNLSVVIDAYTSRSWVSGCFLLLGILQLAVYFFNRDRKINLCLSIYSFLQLSTMCNGILLPLLPGSNLYFGLRIIFNLAAPAAFIFLLVMTYMFFGYRRHWWFYILVSLYVPVCITEFIANNAYNEYVLAVYNVMSYLAIIAVAAKAVKAKKSGSWFFLWGIIISLVFFVLFNMQDVVITQPYLVVVFEVAVTFLIPAVVLSILLAREFAQSLFSLRQKIVEVENLSAKSLQQEVEKQQILERQKEMLEQKVTERTTELGRSLTELKATQNQLIQSEKMASLGELTAGIAHEIQNPLNFVNNFSEVSAELMGELKEELQKGDIEEATAIATDVEQNLEKIKHHGKRADGIVKGMLQHSRASSGQKEPANINELADEYLKLSYHGLRVKDKNFNSTLVTNFDDKLPLANVIPQDIGRVLLNLFNNAFYAVKERQKAEGEGYKPQIEVLTALKNDKVIITVKDNGSGIPDSIKDKIMQPFFTTKPTGEGTGLGLSLSYDIVVKGHGGNISVESKEGGFTEFTVSLPVGNE